jgi:hypothetical protein
MPLLGEFCSPELAKLIARVINDACKELNFANAYDGVHARTVMALDIIEAVDAGERDPEQLKLVALDAVDCRITPDDPAGGS